jgi:acyl carrier protein
LGADSLSVVEIVMSLEEKLGITVPDGDLERLNTVGELCEYLSRQVEKMPPEAD